MRAKIVAGNWKQNLNLNEAYDLMEGIDKAIKNADVPGVGIVIAPPAVYLSAAADVFEFTTTVAIAAQDNSRYASGAHTGEISAEMLASCGCDYVILGHSERRSQFQENAEILNEKLERALESRLRPIFCVGEDLEERRSGKYLEVVKTQLQETLFKLPRGAADKIIIAYEPVWAIGTGETASPEQAQEVHESMRMWVKEAFDSEMAEKMPMLYGGSCKPSNAAELFAKPDIDGGLIGGASLKAEDFIEIIKAAGKA